MNMAQAYPAAHLTAAVQKLQQETELRKSKKAEYPDTLDDRYRRMFAKMGTVRGRYVKGLGFCLEPEEKALLAQYLFTEAQESEKPTLSAALMEDLDEKTARGLYTQCIKHYDDKGYRPMFESLRTDRKFADIVEKEFGYKPDSAFAAMLENRAPEYFNGVAGMKISAGGEGYFEALEKLGVVKDCKLFEECAQLYVLVCDAKEYKRIGADQLRDVTASWNDDLKRRLLSNMLMKLDEFQLRAFIPMLDMFIKLTGPKGTAAFDKNLAGIPEKAKRKYLNWMNQQLIFGAFGPGERAEFWVDFIESCSITKHGPSGALIFDFGGFKVIEFKSDLAAYFYDTEYFDRVVVDGLSTAGSERELDAWLEKRTDWVQKDDDENKLHWRKAHKGNWKIDMMEYIRTHSGQQG